MSTPLALDFVRFGQITHYAHGAAYTVFVYDWLLCLGDELEFVSTPGPILAKIAYLCCRYCLLITYPITLYIQGIDHGRTLCEHVFRIPMLFALPNLGAVIAILTLRLYAFTGGKRYLVAIVFACYLAIVAFHIWVVVHEAILAPAGQACDPDADGNTNELGSIFVREIHDFTLLVIRLTSGMTKLGAMLLDTFITLAFFTHLLRVMKLKYTQMSVFTRAFLREGAAYFLAISSVNLLNVAFNLQHFAPMADLNVPWSLVLPSLLACRLVLNLRKVEPENATVGTISLDSRKRWVQTPSNHQDIEIGPRLPHYVFSPASPGTDEFYELMETPSTASRSFSQDLGQASPLQRREFRNGIPSPSPPPRIYGS